MEYHNDRYAETPKPPYYAVTFIGTNIVGTGSEEYQQLMGEMVELATKQPGYLGIEYSMSEIELIVTYWKDEESIKAWKAQEDHLVAQAEGRNKYFSRYQIRVCKCERDYGFMRKES